MDPTSLKAARRRIDLDPAVLAAHETLTGAARDVAQAAEVLLRRIEDLQLELEELRSRYSSESAELHGRVAAELLAERQLRERETQALRTELARHKAQASETESALRSQIQELEEKLRRIVATLSPETP